MISVLLVDDDPGILDLSRLFLEKDRAIKVTLCESAESAFKELAQHPFDVIVSDYGMPEMDGITFLKRLRSSSITTPVIIFTGKGREEVVIEALNNGAMFYLQKTGEFTIQFAELKNMIVQANRWKEAHEAQSLLAAIVTSSDDAIIATDLTSHVISWNRAAERIYHIPREKAIGIEILKIFKEEAHSQVTESYNKAWTGKASEHFEVVCVRADQNTFDGSVNISPITAHDGGAIGVSFVIRDLSKQREIERAVVSLITETALRLKNPVELVRGRLLDIIEQIGGDDINDEEVCLQLMTQVRNIEQIVVNLRDLNRAIMMSSRNIPEAYRKYLSQ
ncbi:MAG: response regulator [Methanomicrobiales archaeon]|jgi:PAS domain S-box-containing protein|nr:response regulator [Methanomicrobiales archaeon]